MAHEPTRIKENCDLRRLVEQDLGPAPLRGGRAHLWKCPFHREQKGFSLVVWSDGYRCFGACDRGGDAIDWLMQYRRLRFPEVASVLGERIADKPREAQRFLKSRSEPPEWSWQRRAEYVVSQAEETLWSDAGEPALAYLIGRGLNTRTIRTARLGYVPGDAHHWRDIEGMDVPCGITIPWFAADALWAVKVRRAQGTPKYQQIRGGNVNGLYGADGLAQRKIALFCEGEFDALIAAQEAGMLVAPVTLSSATITLSARWYAGLTHCHTVFVAYDRDAAGLKGAQSLLALSPRFKGIAVPQGNDISDFHLGGGDVYGWIAAHLQPPVPERLSDAI
jgi:hypothetical protein